MSEHQEEYLFQLYADAAKAQLRLGALGNGLVESLSKLDPPVDCEASIPPASALKGMGRARIKAKQNDQTEDQADFSTLGDLARGSIIFNSIDQILQGVRAFIEGLPVNSIIPKFKNRFAEKKADDTHYRDIIMTCTLDNGHITEMQFHSKDIIDIKNEGAVVSPANRSVLKEKVAAIDRIVKTGATKEPGDTVHILENIRTSDVAADENWKLSGHDYYNITRWIGSVKNEAVADECSKIAKAIDAIADNMYDEAFAAASSGKEAAAISELERLTPDTARGWLRTS